MNPIFRQLYKHKKTRERDPNAPPAPTLLGQVKELKDVKGRSDAQAKYIAHLESRIETLERRHRRLETLVEQVIAVINKR